MVQNGLSFPNPFFFFFLLEDSSLRSALGAFFFLLSEAVAGAGTAVPGRMSLIWSGAGAAASGTGATDLSGPTGFTTAFGSAAGAPTIETPTPVPPWGGAICSGAVEG